jgi:TIR domain
MSAESADQAAEIRVDPRAPIFFLSYAHAAGAQTDRHEFFDQLSLDVAELVSLPPGTEPGYIDRSIDPGTHWSADLREAVGTCQVFVAMLSARYFQSEWCGKEWYAFSKRQIRGLSHPRPKTQCMMLPVVWAGPIPSNLFPDVVGRVQRFSPDSLPNTVIAAYEREGILGLRKTDPSAYEAVVWKLAQHIARLQYACWVEPRVLAEHELGDAFTDRSLGIRR